MPVLFVYSCRKVDSNDLKDDVLYYTTDGEAGFKALKAGTIPVPDLIFLDINMPKWDGMKVLTEIRSDKSLCNVPVIMFSTTASPHEMELFLKNGASDFITKPDSYSELNVIVDKVLSHHLPTASVADQYVLPCKP